MPWDEYWRFMGAMLVGWLLGMAGIVFWCYINKRGPWYDGRRL